MIVEIVQSGVAYRKALKTFDAAMLHLGFVTKPMKTADRNEAVGKMMAEAEFKPESYQEIQDAANHVEKTLEGVTQAQAVSSIRKWLKENEIEIPKKPKKAKEAGSSGIKKHIDWMFDNAGQGDAFLDRHFRQFRRQFRPAVDSGAL